MLWYLLAAGVALGSVAVLGVGLLGGYRAVKALMRDVSRAGERTADAGAEMNALLAEVQARTAAPPARSQSVRRGDGATLAARVEGARYR